MIKKNFKETTIPEDYVNVLARESLIIAPVNVDKIAFTMMRAVSTMLAKFKNVNVPKAVVFRTADNVFLAAAKVEFIPNGDDPSAGRWDYTWTFYQEDIKDADCIEINSSTQISVYFVDAAYKLYNMRFANEDVAIRMCTAIVEMIISWLKENANENEPTEMVLNDAFTATVAVEDGEVIIGMVPAGAMKVIIKDDSAIQQG